MRYLKTNTATIVTVGPFLDKADGVTLETALTITNERISLVVDLNDGSAPTLVLDNVTGATSGTDNDLNYITNCDAALMQLELAAANVNYLGRAFLTITDAANHCPVFHEFTILPAVVYDSLIAGTDVMQADMTQILGTAVSTPATAGLLDVNAIQISGDATAANNAESFFDGTGYAGTNNVIPTVTTLTGHTAQTGDSFARLGAPAGASVSADIAAVKSDTADILVDTGTTLDALIKDVPTVAEFEARTLPSADYVVVGDTLAAVTTVGTTTNLTNLPAAAALEATLTAMKGATFNGATDSLEALRDRGDAAWITADVSALATSAALATVAGIVDDILVDTGTTLDALIKDVPTVAEFEARTLPSADYVVVTDTIARVTLVDTTTTNTDMVAAAPSAATIADAVWDEAIADHAGVGSTGAALAAASAPSAAVVADAVWDELLAGHVIVGSAGAGLAAAGSAGDPWSTPLPGAYAAGTAGKLLADLESGTAGSGAISHTLTINDGTNPIDGAEVWVTTDLAGSNVVAGTLSTDAMGEVTFMLDAGSYYAWVQVSGFNFANPTAFTVV